MKLKLSAAVAAAVLVAGLVLSGTAQAATLFADDFSDGNADGWTKSGGSWSVSAGAYQQTSTGADAKAQAGSTAWTAQTVTAQVRPTAFGNTSRSTGIAARAQNMTNYYSLVLVGGGSVQLRRISGGAVTTLASAPLVVSTGTTYTLTLSAIGSSLTGVVNGAALVSATDSTFSAGRIGLIASFASAVFDDITVTDTAAPAPSGSSSPSPPAS